MANVLRVNRKINDKQVIRLNAVGLSQGTIAKLLDCHPASVSLRLKNLNIPTVDTRKSFMEDVFIALPSPIQEGLADLLEATPTHTINDYVRTLIERDIAQRLNSPTEDIHE